ncbi:hypothetical protein Tsubulata_037388 [Turnera subulata]|uniref:Uncharacterized protein n=1 Tax=Turnera subulata TaxID=218843 RepID=A0A9Q0F4I9_9ROSI|nr:hypothetical protein Tsubulata_037388 [Turnera subulata]
MAGHGGGAFLSALIGGLLQKMDTGLHGRKLGDGLMEELKNRMISVRQMLDDASKKQNNQQTVADWLDELTDVAYQVDDLLDEIAYESLQENNLEASGQVHNFLSSCNPFNKGKRKELRKILEKIDHLSNHQNMINTVGLEVYQRKISVISSARVTPQVDVEPVVYGRDVEKKALVQWLLSPNENQRPLDLISIVGLGGVGKTTLAKLIYNDETVSLFFHNKIWLVVAETFDVRRSIQEVLDGTSSMNSGNMMTDGQTLPSKIENRVLLVLDDVWEYSESIQDFFFWLSGSVAEGSKVVVTTRFETVAQRCRTLFHSKTPSFQLKVLSSDDSWLFFVQFAFLRDSELRSDTNFERIGRAIVKKCGGLPLAIKVLGRLLRDRNDVKEWEDVLQGLQLEESGDSDRISDILMLSYHQLPPHLKPCFAYLGMFPKDSIIDSEGLVHLWMAEGLLTKVDGDKEIEEVGEECIQDLISRCFLEKAKHSPRLLTMHDLIHDVAISVSGNLCSRIEAGAVSSKDPGRARYLSFDETVNSNSGIIEDHVSAAEFLRSFSSMSTLDIHMEKGLDNLLMSLTYLRVLHLPGYTSLTDLPKSIGKLKHLHYMNLSGSMIKTLPKSMFVLYHLETLILKYCDGIVKIPDLIGNLKGLRHLDLEDTSIQRLPATIARLTNLYHLNIRGTDMKEMPPQIGRLSNLVILQDFFVGKRENCRIEELGSFRRLSGELCIHNLQNAVKASAAAKADLRGKEHIKKLELRWSDESIISGPSPSPSLQHEKNILDQLQPHTNLEYLEIHGYGDESFPSWVGDPSFSKLVTLILFKCRNSTCLPPLGQLVFLKELTMYDFMELEIVNPEFYGDNSVSNNYKPFQSLERLVLSRMPKLKSLPEGIHSFPSLVDLEIVNCPEIESFPEQGLPSKLKTLVIEGCKKLFAGRKQWPLSELPLLSFTIGNWEEVETFPGEASDTFLPSKLISLTISGLPNLKTLRLDHLGCLRELDLRSCGRLKSLPDSMHDILPALTVLRLSDCRNLESFPKEGLPSSLEVLHVSFCPLLEKRHRREKEQDWPHLSHINNVNFTSTYSILPCNQLIQTPEDSFLLECSCDGFLMALADSVQDIADLMMI